MKNRLINITATWDGKAGAWVATSTDVQGLEIDAERPEDLESKVETAIADLLGLSNAEALDVIIRFQWIA
ncbi:DUF1902 domain-containing protein [Pseudohalocynthiibacter aestuariivivens]|uniref:DUF1902 domain-containing protein n=1 Tax=Pseudohalocynthiibacter aestuariivivens TaxID=1591409 RepID=A0ABV5JGS7_9RHOB|nr:DUF1902 domain-containing protein [Pseudohalocynthiibacter aestuariivivens]MBS9719047.1 DUF1902 domain-containing protein [Pseudohalocynthiibacter aestuariivivens]